MPQWVWQDAHDTYQEKAQREGEGISQLLFFLGPTGSGTLATRHFNGSTACSFIANIRLAIPNQTSDQPHFNKCERQTNKGAIESCAVMSDICLENKGSCVQ